jgi:hypothetical protein
VSEATATAAAPEPAPTPRPPTATRRSVRLRVVLIVALVAAIAFLGVELWLTRGDGDGMTGAEAADALVVAYTRNLDATFLVEGQTTRTLDDGRTLSSAYLVVQRPPDRLQRALGSTTGDIGGRSVNCSVSPEGGYSCAASGVAEPWEQQRAAILAALDTYVRGDDPVYTVKVDDADCFVLTRRRTEPDATYGKGARLCFDPRYSALRRLEVQRDGGATDVMLADRVTDEVTNADFDLGEDSTYDPQVPDQAGSPSDSAQETP